MELNPRQLNFNDDSVERREIGFEDVDEDSESK
jgi:hypothetical protein